MRCECELGETPSVRNDVQHCETPRKNSFSDYESPALPLSYRPFVVGKLEQLETPSAIHPHARFCQHHNIEATAHKSPFPVPQTRSASSARTTKRFLRDVHQQSSI